MINLANFSHGILTYPFHSVFRPYTNSSWLAHQTTATTLDTPKNIQPPEVLTGHKIDIKSDMWTLGYTVSSITPSSSLSEPCSLIILNQTYFLLTGKLLFNELYVTSPVEVARETLGKLERPLTGSGNVAEKDITSTVKFLRTCLAVNIENRAMAHEVIEGSWITTRCAYGWCGF